MVSTPQGSASFSEWRRPLPEYLGLNGHETWNALALAFNRCGGSFQSHIDGSLGVRFVQGWVAQGGLLCARLAHKGITGPKNFLEGVYGYLHLYGKDLFTGESITAGLGEEYRLEKMVYKKYPSCALTQGPTDVTLKLMAEEGISAGDIDKIEITVPPYTYKLVGHEFETGDNPRVRWRNRRPQLWNKPAWPAAAVSRLSAPPWAASS